MRGRWLRNHYQRDQCTQMSLKSFNAELSVSRILETNMLEMTFVILSSTLKSAFKLNFAL